MRILCLHGKGTSGLVFQTQTISLCHFIPKSLNIEYDFVDGPCRDAPAPGVDLFYPPPYYAFWKEATADEISNARKWLSDHIAKSGPYDAVMTFSQGCALASSFLLHHQKEHPDLPPPFKAAIFICGGPALADLKSLGFEIPAETIERDVTSGKLLAKQADSSAILASGADRWAGASGVTGTEEGWRSEIKGELKIEIPTVHVYGEKDPRYVAGVQLSGLCEESKRMTYNHGGGHEIPRKEEVSRTIAGLIVQALRQS
ncbi:hypothetical protein ASPWEDRAFT_173185 [Aspergillus wentii DTO 134E9]|uniref:Serine hydrolase domain-containing protein n=1 Tax=Aspergillus wentii DTO 134E9 TaxID=1073089 RepID=A0A1L9RFQ1_ASPWE|nr:uncharacterized protein ASPWEDRAFT_173185 [Aspergillus wentii DTO 134E9]KAI9925511.1 hypothetical protein MW887_005892 [Aspergillus wentii]OJJ33751.1 hypothetical protein ASPWEDRAFT_173185 [Aspergillus wentii DTO 134E9]